MTEASPLFWAGGVGAAVAGLTGSLHCALMCGPLACAGLPRGDDRAGRRRAIAGWHFGRLLAYTAVGAALGFAGQSVAGALRLDVQPYLPWVMAAGLLISAFELGRHLRPLPGVARVSRALARAGAHLSPTGRAFALGSATPFLPCGLLYGVFLAAMATGSWLDGGALMACFGLGAIPALAGVQVGASWGARFPRAALVLRRAVPLAAAAVLVWRALAGGHAAAGEGPACH